ncbi:MAG: GAF domain-containing protein [Candidatus Eremiobacteraeota bacterium]|nr:GAF domain-containing protein [Candidatus Eremiobacteraeota bacterium]
MKPSPRAVGKRGRDLIAKLPETLDLFSQFEQRPFGGVAHEFAQRLYAEGDGLFAAACVFRSQEFRSFIAVHATGEPSCTDALRTWRRDIFDRLLEKRCSAVLSNARGVRALAVPINAGRERYVCLFRLRDGVLTAAEWAFVKAMEARGRALSTGPSSESLSHYVPAQPRIVWIGPPSELSRKIERVLAPRSWRLDYIPFLPQLRALAGQRKRTDVFIVSAEIFRSLATAFRAIRGHGAFRESSILAFVEGGDSQTNLAADACLSSAADGDSIFRTMKTLLRFADSRRSHALSELLARASTLFSKTQEPAKLARAAVTWLGEHFADWVCLHAFDSAGDMIVVQPDVGPRLPSVPEAFLAGTSKVLRSVSDSFIAEISRDGEFQASIRRLGPGSAALLSLAGDGKVFGTIACFTFDREWDDHEADAVARFGEIVSGAFSRSFRRAAQL